jgi:hypothetical protein
MNRPFAKSKRAAGDNDLIPSTSAVFFPWLSCVTRLTANTRFDQDPAEPLLGGQKLGCGRGCFNSWQTILGYSFAVLAR